MRRVGVTRSAEQLRDLAERALARDIEIIPLPIIATQQISFSWPDEVKLSDVTWVCFTSANGVEAFFSRLGALNLCLSPDARFAVVGVKTNLALRAYGHRAEFVPSEAYGKNLFEEFAATVAQLADVVIYARGKAVNYDPAELFASRGIGYVPLVCYETTSRPADTKDLCRLTRDDYILFTAPSAVEAYQEHHGKPLARPIAIGRSTAAEMNRFGWFGVTTMKSADIDSIVEYV